MYNSLPARRGEWSSFLSNLMGPLLAFSCCFPLVDESLTSQKLPSMMRRIWFKVTKVCIFFRKRNLGCSYSALCPNFLTDKIPLNEGLMNYFVLWKYCWSPFEKKLCFSVFLLLLYHHPRSSSQKFWMNFYWTLLGLSLRVSLFRAQDQKCSMLRSSSELSL